MAINSELKDEVVVISRQMASDEESKINNDRVIDSLSRYLGSKIHF